ncbi:MAG: hypothetical protein HQL32_14965, partial [Planctomycetes bacterium]|nr:hypothetical protein [Planctomycetota bacterium]
MLIVIWISLSIPAASANFVLKDPKSNAKLRLGGWLDTRYFNSDKPGNSNSGFDAHHFYFHLDGRLDKNWRAFAEVEFEHATKTGSSQ